MSDVIAFPTKEDWERVEAINHEIAVKVINLLDENQRLRVGIQDYLDGNYENARKHRHEDPQYRCKHGLQYWEDCSQCIDEHFTALLAKSFKTSEARRTCATCHAVLADGPQPAATYADDSGVRNSTASSPGGSAPAQRLPE